jgi:hypothetical protein
MKKIIMSGNGIVTGLLYPPRGCEDLFRGRNFNWMISISPRGVSFMQPSRVFLK